MTIIRLCLLAIVIALVLGMMDLANVHAMSTDPTAPHGTHITSGEKAQPAQFTTPRTPDTDNSMHTPLYSCTYDSAGTVVECVVVGTYNPDKPQIEQ